MLLCPVRHCQKPLLTDGKRRICPVGHSFDIARAGYTNLLQPQERRSKHPGDSRAVASARRRIHEEGHTSALRDAISHLAAVDSYDRVLDAGCGDGFYLGEVQLATNCEAHGIDISIPAVELAARRYPQCEWIVANADRLIPYSQANFSLVLSITARMNPAEFHRVIHPDGRLLIALPAPDDLIEFRGESLDRTARTISAFHPYFSVLKSERVTTQSELSSDSISDLLCSIYRPRTALHQDAQPVTFSLDLLLFRPQ